MPRPRLLAAAALAPLLLAVSARAADEPVTLNFVNADIEAVVKAVAEMTGRNFVLDPRVKGVINIVSARPVPASLVYPPLLSALRLPGYAAVETDGITNVVPEAAGQQPAGSRRQSYAAREGAFADRAARHRRPRRRQHLHHLLEERRSGARRSNPAGVARRRERHNGWPERARVDPDDVSERERA